MIHVVPVEAGKMAGKDWLLLERPCGEKYLMIVAGADIHVPAPIADALCQAHLSVAS